MVMGEDRNAYVGHLNEYRPSPYPKDGGNSSNLKSDEFTPNYGVT